MQWQLDEPNESLNNAANAWLSDMRWIWPMLASATNIVLPSVQIPVGYANRARVPDPAVPIIFLLHMPFLSTALTFLHYDPHCLRK